MEEAVVKIVEYLLSQGLSGLIILALSFMVFKLYNRNQELHNTLFQIGQESIKANHATTAALHRLTDLLLYGNRNNHEAE